jgi:hypothetical protein
MVEPYATVSQPVVRGRIGSLQAVPTGSTSLKHSHILFVDGALLQVLSFFHNFYLDFGVKW